MKAARMRAIAAIAAAFFAVLGVAIVGPASSAQTVNGTAGVRPAGVDDFTFESFDAQYFLELDERGYVMTRVVETIVAIFPEVDQNRGIIRAIPDEAFGFDLDVQLQSLTDERGEPVFVERYEASRYDDQDELIDWVEFYVDDDTFKHGRTTYVLEYTMKNSIVNTDNGFQEFYWDINGDGWPQQFGTVTAEVRLSAELQAALVPGGESCYYEYDAERSGQEFCDIAATDDGFSASAAPVWPYSTLTVAIPFEPGTVTQTVRPADSWVVQIAPKAIAGIIGLLLLAGIVIRATIWRNPRQGLVIAQYEPPEDMHVLLSAEFIDEQFRALPAQFIDFAVRGMIRIIDTSPGAAASRDPDRYQFELLTADGASPKELRVLTIVFGAGLDPGTKVNPGRFTATTGAALYALKAETTAFATKEGYRALPGATLPRVLRNIGLWSVLMFVPIWVYAFWNDVEDDGPITLPMWLSIVGWIVLAIVLVRPNRLTAKGAAARDYLLGMKLYLTVAEEQRMQFLQSPQGAQRRRIDPNDRAAIVHLYERLLPYAVLWNVEDQWIEQLRLRYEEAPPTWVTSNVVDTSFINALTYSSTAAVRPIVTQSSYGGSSWSSSSGSSSSSGGSFGGGFSGGGGGGGGGGGR